MILNLCSLLIKKATINLSKVNSEFNEKTITLTLYNDTENDRSFGRERKRDLMDTRTHWQMAFGF